MALYRKPREDSQEDLFERGYSWEDFWWGMPSYQMADARPLYRVTVNIFTLDDLIEFGRRLGIRVTPQTDTVTFPVEDVDKPSDWIYTDEP